MTTPETVSWAAIEVPNLDVLNGITIVDIPYKVMEQAFLDIENPIARSMGSTVTIQGTPKKAFFNTLGRHYQSKVAGVAPHFMAINIDPQKIGETESYLTARLYAPYNSPKAAEYTISYTAKEGRIGRNNVGLVICREVLDKTTIDNPYLVSNLGRLDVRKELLQMNGGRRHYAEPTI